MRAIQIGQHGGPEVLQVVAVAVPEARTGEVRVRHRAVGVNLIDTYFRSGLYPLPQLPAILGEEAAGVVEAVGPGVTNVRVGDRVAYVARGPGSYAEARVIAAERAVKLPDAIGFETAAAMMLKGLTVQYLLRRTRTGLEPGDAILWHAGAGGVGLIACQWARALGYVVIATAGTPEKCELARAHGAEHVIDYRREDVIARVKTITGGRGVKVVYDSVGKDTWDRSLGSLAPLGLMVSFGNSSGPPPALNVLDLTRRGSIYVTRPTLQTHLSQPGAQAEMTAELFDVVLRGIVTIPVRQRYRLEEAQDAHRDLEDRKTTGTSVLVP